MPAIDDRDEMPRSLQLLWKRDERRTRGQHALNLERIVATAIDLADAEGIQALSMARLAERLGCATMSLYRHVANKDELQVFMMDAAVGAAPLDQIGGQSWRAGMERWAAALRGVYLRHPWILQLSTGRPPLEPGQLAWLDCGLRALRGAKLGPQDRLAVVLAVLNYVRGEAQIAVGLRQTDAGGVTWGQAEAQSWYGRTLAKLVDPDQFPALAELIDAGTFDLGAEDDEAEMFEFGLARLLDGVDALLRDGA